MIDLLKYDNNWKLQLLTDVEIINLWNPPLRSKPQQGGLTQEWLRFICEMIPGRQTKS